MLVTPSLVRVAELRRQDLLALAADQRQVRRIERANRRAGKQVTHPVVALAVAAVANVQSAISAMRIAHRAPLEAALTS